MNAYRSVLPLTLAAILAGGACFAAEQAAPPTRAHHPHEGDISAYQGTKTCAECHEDAVKDMALSLHYQQLGDAPNLDDWPAGKKAGMMSNY